MELSRRSLLATGTLAVVGSPLIGEGLAAEARAATRRVYLPYSKDSFFKSRVRSAPVDRERTRAFRRLMKSHPDQQKFDFPLINGIGSNKWGTAFAKGRASHPIWRLTGNVNPEVGFLKTRGFHAPRWLGKMFSGTNDSPFVVLDRGFGGTVWAANAKVVAPYTISVSAAGWFSHDSNGLDRRNPRSNSRVNFRSRGAIPDAMVIRRDALDRAIARGTGLGHVLHVFLVETRTADGFCHPMVGEESGKFGFGAEGERIRIKPGIDLRSRVRNPAGLAIARTLQQHGMYIGDNSGSATALKAEQTSAARDPWAGSRLTREALSGLTWDDFQVVKRGWHA